MAARGEWVVATDSCATASGLVWGTPEYAFPCSKITTAMAIPVPTASPPTITAAILARCWIGLSAYRLEVGVGHSTFGAGIFAGFLLHRTESGMPRDSCCGESNRLIGI